MGQRTDDDTVVVSEPVCFERNRRLNDKLDGIIKTVDDIQSSVNGAEGIEPRVKKIEHKIFNGFGESIENIKSLMKWVMGILSGLIVAVILSAIFIGG